MVGCSDVTRLLIGFVMAAFLVDSSISTNPGLTLMLSQNGLNYAADIAITKLVSDVQGQSIPDQHGEDRNNLGRVTYDIQRTTVTSFSRPASSVVVTPETGVTWSLTDASAAVHGDWRYKYKKSFVKISDHGSFDISVSGVSLRASIEFGADKDGRPTISMTSCTSAVGDVHVKFHGGASFLYNLFRKVLERPIADTLKKMMCDSVRKAVTIDAAQSLAKMKVQVPVEGILTLDYRLVSPPVIGKSYLESLHKGEFLWTEKPSETPFPPNAVTVPRDTHKMMTFCLSDYVMNSLGYAIYNQGYLKYNVTKSDIPEKYCSYLSTNCDKGICIGSFLPKLKQMYPDGSVELHMTADSPPSMTTTNDVIIGSFAGRIVFNVRLPDNSLHHAFTSNVDIKMPLTVNMTGDHVTAHVKSLKFNINDTKSDIGDIDKAVDFLLNLVCQHFIVHKLNEIGKKGLHVPGIEHVKFINPELTLIEGAICFNTDAEYDPTFQPQL